MSDNSGERIRKKGFIDRINFVGQSFTDTPGATKWGLFKALFFGKFGTITLLNLLTVLFAAPGAVVIVLFYFESSVATSLLPYSANFGIGYPVTVDVASLGVLTTFRYVLYEFLLLIPCIAVFAVGIAGNLFAMNKLASGEEVKLFKDFFRGIKKSGLSAFIVGLVYGLIVAGVGISFVIFDAYGLHVAFKAVALTCGIILLLFGMMFLPYFMTQSAYFKLPVGTRISNSFAFLFGTPLSTLIAVVLAVGPLFTVFIPGFAVIYAMLFMIMGISYASLVLTVNCRECYAVCFNGKAAETVARYNKKEKDKDKEKEENDSTLKPDDAVEPTKKSKRAAVQYKNPKKKKRE